MILLSSTVPMWAERALSNLPALLSDHLHCERKAAENALALVRRYPEQPRLTEALSRLAHEETSHLVQMSELCERRAFPVRHDVGNRYARELRAEIREREPERMLDALLVSAFIEARSHERLTILGRALGAAGDHELAELYRALGTAEERHHELFVELADDFFPHETVRARLAELAAREAEIIAGLPPGPRVH